MDVPAGVTQEEGNTGFSIHLLSAVLALIFLARRIQPFLSLVDREVEFCVLNSNSGFENVSLLLNDKSPEISVTALSCVVMKKGEYQYHSRLGRLGKLGSRVFIPEEMSIISRKGHSLLT